MKKIKNLQSGQSLIELLVTMGIAAIIFPALMTGLVATRNGKAQQIQRTQAVALLKETQEIIRVVRENNWSYVGNLSENDIVHPVASGNTWVFANGSELVTTTLTRQIVAHNVYRNNGTIVTSGGTLDPSTKKLVTTISWNTPIANSVSATTYITRFNNTSYTETTNTQFNAGTKTNVVVTNTSGGEVTLGAGGGGDWCNPNLSITALDLPKNGVANAVTAIEGRAFAGTGDNSSGVSFANITITNAHPPSAAVAGTFDGFKTNGVFGETNYAYLATDNNSKEIEIVNLTTNPYSESGYFNAPGNGSGNSVFVSGNVGYMTDGGKLYTFDLSSKSGSRSQLGSADVFLSLGTAQNVVVVGNYAYVTVSGSIYGLQIFNVSNPGSPSLIAYANFNFLQNASGLYVNPSGTRAYMALTSSFGFFPGGFYIINTSDKNSSLHSLPTISTYQTNGMNPKGISVVPGNKAIVVGSGGEQYQVVDITNENSPVRCGGLTNPNGASSINAIASIVESDGDAYSYILTDNATKEFQIIEGGPGGQFATNGTFESQTFTAATASMFNKFTVTAIIPAQTTLTFQIGIAHAINGSCNGVSYTFAGPNGTSSGSDTFPAAGGIIPASTDGAGFENPGKCLRYRAYLSSTDLTQTPVLDNVTFNYSP